MKRSRFTKEQIIGILREQEAGISVADLCRKYGLSSPASYKWKAKYADMDVSEGGGGVRWKTRAPTLAAAARRRDDKSLCKLGDAAGVVLVVLVAHGRERRVHLAGLHADDVEASFAKVISQVLGERDHRRLLPLLEFGREREGVDLSGIKLTHHTLKNEGKRDLIYGAGEASKLPGVSEVGSGGIHEKEKALLDEIIARVNDLFGANTTDGDRRLIFCAFGGRQQTS